MGKTLAEKILSLKSGTDAQTGDIVIARVDLVFVQDTTGPLTVRQFLDSGIKTPAQPDKTILFMDHAAPSPQSALSNDRLRKRAESNCPMWVKASVTKSWLNVTLNRGMSL
jgi:3-isopropylmalate/(R)-2-methylmalate dehydratase large subunit